MKQSVACQGKCLLKLTVKNCRKCRRCKNALYFYILNKVVNKPEDLAGQRIRTIGNDICTTAVNNMGAVATPMSWNEVYTSLQQGALDGAEIQTSSFYATRLWEVVNTINRTRHFLLVGCAATGTGFCDSLSSDYQQLFLDTFYEVGEDFQATNDATCAA